MVFIQPTRPIVFSFMTISKICLFSAYSELTITVLEDCGTQQRKQIKDAMIMKPFIKYVIKD